MKDYVLYKIAKSVVAGLSLIGIMVMFALPASAHGLYQFTTADSGQLASLLSESYAPAAVEANHQQGIAAYHKNCELVRGHGDSNDCCHQCGSIPHQVVSATPNEHEDKAVALFAQSESILPTPRTILIRTGLVASLPPLPLQGALRFRVLLI